MSNSADRVDAQMDKIAPPFETFQNYGDASPFYASQSTMMDALLGAKT
jgi:hypothetical protein